MTQASWGFLAGTAVLAVIVMIELWELSPRHPYGGTEYGAGVAADLRDC